MTRPEIVGMNVVVTRTENPGFAGTKTGVEVSSSKLRLAQSAIDSWSGNVDSVVDWDNNGTLTLTGTYVFNGSKVDLGAVFTSRVTANLRFAAVAVGDLV